MNEESQQAKAALANHLEQQKKKGVKRIRLSPEARARLSAPATTPVAAPTRIVESRVSKAHEASKPTAPAKPDAPTSNPEPRFSRVRETPKPTTPVKLPATPVFSISLPEGDKTTQADFLRMSVIQCRRCEHLAVSRTQTVFGVGNLEASLMFVGEAPGEDEDLQGEPFVGKAGQLLTKMIEAMNISRSEVYIANILKCRPDVPQGKSGNRQPTAQEMATCIPFLKKQIEIIRPRVLVALGTVAFQGLFNDTTQIGKMRGKWLEYQSIPCMITYHPAYLLRNQSLSEKRKVWEDLLEVMKKLELPITEKQRGFFLSKPQQTNYSEQGCFI